MFQGKDLLMDLDDCHLVLIVPQDMTVIHVQPIHSIRVWGVGRDNGRWVLDKGVYATVSYCSQRQALPTELNLLSTLDLYTRQ